MRSCRLAAALLMLAFAGPAAAQVTDSITNRNKSPDSTTVTLVPPSDAKAEAPPVQVSPVPEPTSILLVAGAGSAVGWVAYWRRKWRADPAADEAKPQP